MEYSLNIIMFLIGTITGMFLHNWWIKSEVKKKRSNPEWCSDKETCKNPVCKNMPGECERDLRDLL